MSLRQLILDRGAALLLEKETLDEQDLRELTHPAKSPEGAEQSVQTA